MTDVPDTLPPGPWTASRYADGVISAGWQVKSASGTQILAYVSEPVARAVAAIPEREREIERLRLLVSNADDEHDDQCHRMDELRARVAELEATRTEPRGCPVPGACQCTATTT